MSLMLGDMISQDQVKAFASTLVRAMAVLRVMLQASIGYDGLDRTINGTSHLS